MRQTVEAIYDDGVLHPLEKLSLRPKQRVFLQIAEGPNPGVEIDDKAFLSYCLSEGDSNITLEEVRLALAVIPRTLTDACSADRDER